MTKVFCSNCGITLYENVEVVKAEDPPCPKCGSTNRDIQFSLYDGVNLSDHMSAVASKDDKAVGYRESENNGRVASADQNDDNTLSYSLTGSSPQGEEDTLKTCKILGTST